MKRAAFICFSLEYNNLSHVLSQFFIQEHWADIIFGSDVQLVIFIQLKCEVIENTSQGASDGRYQTVSVSKCCMSRGRSVSGNVYAMGFGTTLIVIIIVQIWPLVVSYMTQKEMQSITILCLCVLFQLLISGLSPQQHIFTCVIRFYIQKLSFDKLSLMKTIS